MGASLGFLIWNFKPAKIFMGDGGAMFLGFLMATLAAKMRFSNMHHRISWIVPLLILAVPIFDTTLVTISRSRRGLLPFATPGKDHASHRLTNLGMGQRNAVLVMYGGGIAFGLLALLLSRLSLTGAYIAGAGALVTIGVAVCFWSALPTSASRKNHRRPRRSRNPHCCCLNHSSGLRGVLIQLYSRTPGSSPLEPFSQLRVLNQQLCGFRFGKSQFCRMPY